MISKNLKLLISTTLLMGLSATVWADEVWNTNIGEVVYQSEVGPTAVWTYGTKEKPGVIYILGLAQIYKNRGTYEGYWAEKKTRVTCRTSRLGHDGKPTKHWGSIQIHFIDKDFPSKWVARWSYCNANPENQLIRAQPVVAEANAPAS